MFRQSIARPLELLESWIDGQVRQFRGNWREAGRGIKGVHGVEQPRSKWQDVRLLRPFSGYFPCVTEACWSKFVQWLSFQTWGCTIIWIFANFSEQNEKWPRWKLKPGERKEKMCFFLQFEYIWNCKKLISNSMKNGQGGLVGGEGGGRRKAEICSFRCLPTTKVQLRQLCFRMNLSAHAKKNVFLAVFCAVPVFVCLPLFCQKQRAITKLERCSHGERVTSKPTQNIVTRWEDGQ